MSLPEQVSWCGVSAVMKTCLRLPPPGAMTKTRHRLARRRSTFTRAVAGQGAIPITDYRDWMAAPTVAIAPICPPAWLPMSELARAVSP
jgi:hypothetical protein